MTDYPVIASPQSREEHSEEWYQLRRRGIGGSDSAAVLGKSRYKTPFQVWLEKDKRYIDENGVEQVSLLDDRKSNEAMEMGSQREPFLIQRYSNKTGKTVVQPGSLVHPEFPYVCVNLDGLIPDDRIIECKTTENGMEYNRESGKWAKSWDADTGEVPVSYYFQCQHGMMIAVALGLIPADNPLCDLFVSIGGKDIQIYTIKGDPELWEAMLVRYEEFWGYVERNERPEITTDTDIALAYPVSTIRKREVEITDYTPIQALGDVCVEMFDELRTSYQRDPDVVNTIGDALWAIAPLGTTNTNDGVGVSITDSLSRCKAAAKLLEILENIKDRYTMVVKGYMEDSEVLIDNEGNSLCTWKSDSGREQFDKNKFKKENPELYKKYTWRSEPSRRFLIK